MLLDILKDPRFQTADSPTFIYFEEIIAKNLQDFRDLTYAIPNRKCMYSTKAATFPFLLRILYQQGVSAFDASSVTEAQFIHNLMGNRIELYVTAPAIHAKEFAILEKIQPTCVHLDSIASLTSYLTGNWTFPIGVRLNPGVGYSRIELHEAGGRNSRLGLPLAELKNAIALFNQHNQRDIGLHFHVSCEAKSFAMQTATVQQISACLAEIERGDIQVTHLDIGGGLLPPLWDFKTDTFIPRVQRDSILPLATALAELQTRQADWFKAGFQILHEPGDFLTAATAILVAEVLEERQAPGGKNHLMLDTNINHFPNVLHYNNTPLSLQWPLLKPDEATREAVISGNSCLGGDNILTLPISAEHVPTHIIFTERGSYEYTQLNFFNGRFRPAVYLLKQDAQLVKIKEDTAQDLAEYWREDVDKFPQPYQSFHLFEEIAQQAAGVQLYHPEMRHISSFELDSTAFPPPEGLKKALIENFDVASMLYGRSLGIKAVRERIARYENQVVGQADFYTDSHCAFTLGSTNAIWLIVNALFKQKSRRLLILTPNYYQYSNTAALYGIPWSYLHHQTDAALENTLKLDADVFLPSLAEVHQAIDRAPDIGALVISNPGFPHGMRLPPDYLQALAQRAAAEKWVLVLDETMAELDYSGVEDAYYAWLTATHPVIRLKTFSKTFGIAGMRLGYLCATEAVLALSDAKLLDEVMATAADAGYSAPPAVLGSVLMAGLDILSQYRNGASTHPDVRQFTQNLAKLQQRAEQAAEILTQWDIPHHMPSAGPNIMVFLPKLNACAIHSIPFFRELVKEHKLFLELGGIFSQNPDWPYSIGRIALGRPEHAFAKDIETFCQFYQAYSIKN